MITANKGLREKLRINHVTLWEVAHKLGICEGTLVRKLRMELSEEESDNILLASETILNERRQYVNRPV
jgi:hypothetical protein